MQHRRRASAGPDRQQAGAYKSGVMMVYVGQVSVGAKGTACSLAILGNVGLPDREQARLYGVR
jgi:hypothetical protein